MEFNPLALAIWRGLVVHTDQMARNLALTGGLIVAEAVMMHLGQFIGRGRAQRVYTVQQVLGRRALERIDPAQAPHLPPVEGDPTSWRPTAS